MLRAVVYDPSLTNVLLQKPVVPVLASQTILVIDAEVAEQFNAQTVTNFLRRVTLVAGVAGALDAAEILQTHLLALTLLIGQIRGLERNFAKVARVRILACSAALD